MDSTKNPFDLLKRVYKICWIYSIHF